MPLPSSSGNFTAASSAASRSAMCYTTAMTENLSLELPAPEDMFARGARKALEVVDIFAHGSPLTVLQEYNRQMGLGLDQPSMEYLVAEYLNLGRSPSDIELFMWAQVNSEHVGIQARPREDKKHEVC